jgi:hypothetical protein
MFSSDTFNPQPNYCLIREFWKIPRGLIRKLISYILSLTGVKWLVCEADHSPSYSAEVKNGGFS